MTTCRKRHYDFDKCTLGKLCGLVKSFSYPYEDLAELIEDRGFEECRNGNADFVLEELVKLSQFFENMTNKNEENVRDLADIYLLAGELCQSIRKFEESILWFKKAIIVDDIYDVPYHSLAFSYLEIDEIEKAIKCLEQEIKIAPGNYYAYLFLAELNEKIENDDEVEAVLRDLLSRDSNNIQGLHKLICYYEKRKPELDVEFLRRRLFTNNRQYVVVDLIILVYHMCKVEKHREALRFLEDREKDTGEISIIHLLRAYVFGKLKQYKKRSLELKMFVKQNNHRELLIRALLDEFSRIFGNRDSKNLEKKIFNLVI